MVWQRLRILQAGVKLTWCLHMRPMSSVQAQLAVSAEVLGCTAEEHLYTRSCCWSGTLLPLHAAVCYKLLTHCSAQAGTCKVIRLMTPATAVSCADCPLDGCAALTWASSCWKH